MPRRVSRPRYPLLRAAPAGRPQRAGGAARAGGWREKGFKLSIRFSGARPATRTHRASIMRYETRPGQALCFDRR